MKTLTPIKALLELAGLPGWSELTARNVLNEAARAPYLVVNDGALFIAHARDSEGERQFLLAPVKRTGSGLTDGAAFAALLNEAEAAGADRLSSRSPLPGWA
jgi:hypothetical protein